MLRVMDEGRLLRDPASLVRSGILRVEDLGTKGLSSNMEDVREWAVRQLRRVADHTSEVAKQVERKRPCINGGFGKLTQEIVLNAYSVRTALTIREPCI